MVYMKKIIFVVITLCFLVQYTSANQYPQDIVDAYTYAYQLWITTKPTIDEAGLTWNLIRSHAAKMLVNRTKEILKNKITDCTPEEKNWGALSITNTDNHVLLCNTVLSSSYDHTLLWCNFDDISQENEELKWYIIQACEAWLMGVDFNGSPMKSFNPRWVITKAQFATILSRFLRVARYNGWNPYYKKHIDALQTVGLMPNIWYKYFETQAEVRGIMLLMLQWADKYLQCLKTDEFCGYKWGINMTFAQWSIYYSTTWTTDQDVIAYLTGNMLTWISSYSYVFKENWNKTFYIHDLFWRQAALNAKVTWIQK